MRSAVGGLVFSVNFSTRRFASAQLALPNSGRRLRYFEGVTTGGGTTGTRVVRRADERHEAGKMQKSRISTSINGNEKSGVTARFGGNNHDWSPRAIGLGRGGRPDRHRPQVRGSARGRTETTPRRQNIHERHEQGRLCRSR